MFARNVCKAPGSIKDVNGLTKLAAGVGVLLIVVAIGFQFSSDRSPHSVSARPAAKSTQRDVAHSAPSQPSPLAKFAMPPVAAAGPQTPAASADKVIAAIKSALARPGGRHAYATFSKLADSIDETDVRDVLAFVETLPKPQEKSLLTSLLVGRWAELDPQAALAYAQNLPLGSTRTWATTSAVSGWVERDIAAATAWAQQLAPGPMREQAMQTVVGALADKDPQAALAFVQNMPAGR